MRTEQHEAAADAVSPDRPELDDVTGYEDGDSHVICEKTNAKAWIRSDVTEAITR